MKISEFRTLIFLIMTALAASSCMSFYETLEFREDGSGNYKYKVDMSATLAGMEGMGQMFSEMDEEGGANMGDFNMDTVVVDSVMSFAHLPDSILEGLEHPDLMERAKVHVNIDGKEQLMIMTFEIDFDRLDQVPVVLDQIEKVMEKEPGDAQADPTAQGLGFLPGEDTGFWLVEKGRLSHPGGGDLMGKMTGEMELGEEDVVQMEEMDMGAMLFAGQVYRSEIIFPGEVKKVEIEGARVVDGNKVILEYDLQKLIDDPAILKGDIEFDMPRSWKKNLKK